MSGVRFHRPWSSRLSALLVVLLLGALPLVAASATPAAAAAPPVIPMTTIRNTILDPVTGRLFVAGDDVVDVLSPTGDLLQSIPDIFGADGMDLDGSGNVWVAETTAGKLAQISTTTFAVTTYAQGRPVSGSLAIARGAVWFPTTTGLGRFDLTSKATSVRGQPVTPSDRLVRLPSTTTRLLATGNAGYPNGGRLLDLTVNPVSILASGAFGDSTSQVSASLGGKLWTGSYYGISEFNLSDLSATGMTYPAAQYPSGTAYSPGHGGTLVATSSSYYSYSSTRVFISHVGTPASTHEIDIPGQAVPSTVRLSNDANRAYVLLQQTDGFSVSTLDLTSTISSVVPSTVVTGVPTKIAISGTGIGVVSAASVDGVAVTATALSSNAVELTVPSSIATGTRTVSLTTPFGTATTSIEVVANTGATLSGTVRSAATPRSGVQMTLSGGGLGAARQVTSGDDGGYSFAGVPYGTTFRLAVHDPTAPANDQVIQGIVLIPNGGAQVDVDLQVRPPDPGARLSDVALPVAPARHIVVDPGTGRVFVSGENEVDVFDRDGTLVTRMQSQWGADGLAVSGSTLYVNLSGAGVINQIDIPSLATTGSITTGLSDGELAVAAGKVFFTGGNDQWVTLRSYDLVSHALATVPGNWYVPRFAPIDGSTTRFLSFDPWSATVVDASTSTVVTQQSYLGVTMASQSLGLAWSSDGSQRLLSDFSVDGTKYPVDGWADASAAGTGGVLAFGRDLARVGTPKATHVLPDNPDVTALAPAGDRAYYVTTSGHFVAYDLKPYITTLGNGPIFDDGTPLTITGTGLGAATSLLLDGQPITLGSTIATRITTALPSTTAGTHTLRVVTPWGTSAPFTFTAVDRPPVPAVASLSSPSVPTAGGPITLNGSGFTGATSVTFGGVPATSFTVVSDSRIDAVVPVHTAGTAALAVTTIGGTNPSSPPFAWVAPTPVVTSISPVQGPLSGGTSVTIHGSGFLFPTAVTFGGTQAATVSVQSDSTIVATAPAHAAGAISVVVSTVGGTSATGAPSTFTYQATPPSVSSLTPNQGLASGGNQVLINGTNLSGATSVMFGTTAASSFVVTDANTIVAVAPAHAAGVATVTVTTPNGTTSANLGALYQYNPIPVGVISGTVSSKAGPTAGMLVVVSPTSTFSVYATTTTAADGSYSVGNLPISTYRVLVLDPAVFYGASSYFVSQWYDHGGSTLGDFATATNVTVSANTTTALNPVSLTHNSAGSLSGTVRNGASTGLVNQIVFLYSATNPSFTTYVLTDGTGHFSISGLPPGAYKVAVMDAAELFGSASHYLSEFYDNGGPAGTGFATATSITVAPNAAVALNPIVLAHTP